MRLQLPDKAVVSGIGPFSGRSHPPEAASPDGVSIRSKVHEYGGGAFFVDRDSLIFTSYADQALWRLGPGQRLERLTPAAPDGEEHRFADARPLPGRGFVAVRERHHEGGVENEVVVIAGGRCHPIVSDHDFVSAPRPSPSGTMVAWVAWDHPNMPWDESELWIASLDVPTRQGPSGHQGVELAGRRRVAGCRDESIGQPLWRDDEELWFVSDRRGWWQPHRCHPVRHRGSAATEEIVTECLCEEEAEFHSPDWSLGQETMDWLGDGRLVCRFRRDGRDRVGIVEPRSPALKEVDQPCVSISALRSFGASSAVLIGASETDPQGLWFLDLSPSGAKSGPLHLLSERRLSHESIARPRHRRVVGRHGISIPYLFFKPVSHDCPPVDGDEGDRAGAPPPLVLICHGGPTGAVEPALDLAIQMWTSRGLAVAAVDYRGSAGYGRAFRESLRGQWGIADPEDCTDVAMELASAGQVDPERMALRGSSAGGLTALNALRTGGPFKAALVSYGVTDLCALARDTHKFESRYLDRLVAPWPAGVAVYEDRSPLFHPERISGAVLLMQGEHDPIVPPSQAASLASALRARGLRCEHVVFPGEGHGFRRSETLTRAAQLEVAFVTEIFGLS